MALSCRCRMTLVMRGWCNSSASQSLFQSPGVYREPTRRAISWASTRGSTGFGRYRLKPARSARSRTVSSSSWVTAMATGGRDGALVRSSRPSAPSTLMSVRSTSTASDRRISTACLASSTVVTRAPVGPSCLDQMCLVVSSSSTTSTLTPRRDGKSASDAGETLPLRVHLQLKGITHYHRCYKRRSRLSVLHLGAVRGAPVPRQVRPRLRGFHRLITLRFCGPTGGI